VIVAAALTVPAPAQVLKLDLDADHRLDTVVLHQTPTQITITVRYGNPARKPDVFHFAVDANREDAVCATPVHLERETHGFAVVDERCDSLHFYWDRKTHRTLYWRL